MAYKDPGGASAYKKAYLLANTEKVRAQKRANYHKHKERHKEKESANNKAWAQANKEKKAANTAKRRLLLANADATMTEAEKQNYQELILIRDEATKSTGYVWSIDHIIPISMGGTNAIDNLEVVPLSWNQSKGNRSTESYWGIAA